MRILQKCWSTLLLSPLLVASLAVQEHPTEDEKQDRSIEENVATLRNLQRKGDVVSCATCSTGTYYDGCNTCNCNGNLPLYCTFRYCEPDEFGDAYCIGGAGTENNDNGDIKQRDADEEVSCRTCRGGGGYYDGCNSCSCNGNFLYACTERYCETNGDSYCLGGREKEIKVSCEACLSGTYYDGCNNCSCDEDNVAICTEKYCPPSDIEKPFCKESDRPGEDCDMWEDVSLELWNADTDTVIGNLRSRIDLCSLDDGVGLTLVASPPCKRRMKFKLYDNSNGSKVILRNTERMSPFTMSEYLGGDDLRPARILRVPGSYTLMVNAKPGKRQTFHFDVVDC